MSCQSIHVVLAHTSSALFLRHGVYKTTEKVHTWHCSERWRDMFHGSAHHAMRSTAASPARSVNTDSIGLEPTQTTVDCCCCCCCCCGSPMLPQQQQQTSTGI